MLGVFAGASPLVLVPPNPPTWSSVLCAAALIAMFTSVAFPCPQFSSAGFGVLSFLPLLAPSRRLFVPVEIVFFTRPVLGALVKVSLSSIFVAYVLSSSSFGLEFSIVVPCCHQRLHVRCPYCNQDLSDFAHQPRSCVCQAQTALMRVSEPRLCVCHQIRPLSPQRSSLRSLTFARFARTFFNRLN